MDNYCLYVCSSAEFYVKVMRKVLAKGSDYIKTEYDRLGRILGELLVDNVPVPSLLSKHFTLARVADSAVPYLHR